MCGQGKLYVRLNVIKDILTDNEKAADCDHITEIESIHDDMAANVDVQNVNISSPVVHIDSQEPSTSTGHSFFDESLGNLRMIFPEKDVDVVTETLIRYEDPDIATHAVVYYMKYYGVKKACGQSERIVLCMTIKFLALCS